MRLSEFFTRAGTRKIVINTDIDGFLSGMILQKYYDCEVVGFSNSKESIWLSPEVDSILSPVYVDIFVNSQETYCIDQHIVAYDNSHIERLLEYRTKLNPNLDVSRRTYSGDLGRDSDYFHKYPFGTVHYLIALMKEDDIDVEFDDLTQIKTVNVAGKIYRIYPAQIILRADDALYSSLGPYKDNTDIWWEHLRTFGATTIEELIRYKDSCDPQRNYEYKRYISDFFREGLNCDAGDGAFNTICNDYDNGLQSRIIEYNRIIGELVGMSMDLPTEVVEHRGRADISSFSTNKLERAFTYAFVCSPNKSRVCFSYTIDIL